MTINNEVTGHVIGFGEEVIEAIKKYCKNLIIGAKGEDWVKRQSHGGKIYDERLEVAVFDALVHVSMTECKLPPQVNFYRLEKTEYQIVRR